MLRMSPLFSIASVAARPRIFLEWGTAAMSALAEAVLAAAAPAPAPAPAPATATPVRSLTKGEFSKRLMVHFDILWRRGGIVWPSRNGEMEMA